MYQIEGFMCGNLFILIRGNYIKKREMSQEIAHCDKKQGLAPLFLK